MDAVLSFFSNLILFTAGLVVLTIWGFILIVVVDEIIDLIVPDRTKSNKEES